MLSLSIKYLKKSKKQTITMFVGIILSSMLLFGISILFSSFRSYLIKMVIKTSGDYHVKIIGSLNSINKQSIVKVSNDTYYIKFKNIKKTYIYTEKICKYNRRDQVVYNNKLLSLYGISREENMLNLFKKVLISIIFILSISVFLIIYNSFNISIRKQKKDIFLFKISGAGNRELYKIYFYQGVIVGIAGIIVGFMISLGFNYFLIKIINKLLYEMFNDLSLSIYLPFILISLFFMLLIIIFASFLPLRNIRKYSIMSFIYEHYDDYKNNYNLNKFFIFNYALLNYEREKKKYRSLIVCLFVFIFLFNSFFIFMKYTFNILNDYVVLPEYDVSLVADYSYLESISQKLKAKNVIVFKMCNVDVQIPKSKFKVGYHDSMNAMITNLGNNEIVNKVVEIKNDGNLVTKLNYEPFKNLNKIKINDVNIDVKLTKNIPFGFKEHLKSDTLILNLSDKKFLSVCPNYQAVSYLTTDKRDIDRLLNDYARKRNIELTYSNIKKARELINNFVLVIKIFVFLVMMLIIFICITTVFNITSANIKLRKKEFSTLNSLGLHFCRIKMILFIESLIISLKSFLYALPFVLLIFKFLYINVGKVFRLKISIFDYRLLLLSFILCLIMVVICMILSHCILRKEELIVNIKNEIF